MSHTATKSSENKETHFVQLLLKWGEKNRRQFPWREAKSPYETLLAEIMLQRTPANRVAAFFPKFVRRFPSPAKLANADLVCLDKIGHSLGLKKRMSWLVKSMTIVLRKYDGKIPNTFDKLYALPGVGEYTASAVLCFGFGRDVPIVDANVVRVYTRVFGLSGSKRMNSSAIKRKANELMPKGLGVRYNEALLDFAALVCKKKPLCEECAVGELCQFYQERDSSLPNQT